MNWQTVIRHYRMKHLPSHRAETKWFADQPTLADAIKKAALAQDQHGKRYAHQRRIPRAVLETSLEKLTPRDRAICACGSFDDLHQLVEVTLKTVKGIGELYCYDTALRIGAKLNLRPKTVFLHAGTKAGASLIIDTSGRRCLTKKDLPPELRQLPAEQVEDILCIYKDRIEKLHNKSLQRMAYSHR